MRVVIEPRPQLFGGPPEYAVRSPWNQDVIDTCKVYGGRWAKADRVWIVPDRRAAESVARTLRSLGMAVTFTDSAGDDPPPRARREPPPRPGRNGAGDEVLVELLERFGRPAFLALTKITHPDTGGDTAWSQRVNGAWEKAQRRRSA